MTSTTPSPPRRQLPRTTLVLGTVITALIVALVLTSGRELLDTILLRRACGNSNTLERETYHVRRFADGDDVLHGTYTLYFGFTKIKIREGQYVNGVEHGVWTNWDVDTGEIDGQDVFDNGKTLEERHQPPWIGGDAPLERVDGVYSMYKSRGRIREQVRLEAGRAVETKKSPPWWPDRTSNSPPDGFFRATWFRKDTPRAQGAFKDGLREGPWVFWSYRGAIQAQVAFRRGEVVEERLDPPWRPVEPPPNVKVERWGCWP